MNTNTTTRFDTLLSIEQVSDWLNVPVETLRSWRKRGTGPLAVKIGKSLRYRQQHVEAFLDAHTERRTP